MKRSQPRKKCMAIEQRGLKYPYRASIVPLTLREFSSSSWCFVVLSFLVPSHHHRHSFCFSLPPPSLPLCIVLRLLLAVTRALARVALALVTCSCGCVCCVSSTVALARYRPRDVVGVGLPNCVLVPTRLQLFLAAVVVVADVSDRQWATHVRPCLMARVITLTM